MSNQRGPSRSFSNPVALLCMISAGLVLGCAPSITNITRPVAADPIIAESNEAVVVVIQPSTRYYAVTFLDGNGQLLGQLDDRSHTILRIPPGAVRLYAQFEDDPKLGDRLQGEVSAGRVYYATISLRFNGLRFNVLHPGSPDNRWANLETYLSRGPRLEMDPARVAVVVDQLGDTVETMRVIDAYADRYPENQVEVHTIRPEYGF